PFYHNYFGARFDGVDSAYGDSTALRDLIGAVHARGMKLFLDQEIQYAAQDNPWLTESQGHPESQYSHFILYNSPGNTEPECAVFGISVVPMWNGQRVGIATVNMLAPEVQQYFANFYAALADPNRDGNFEDGIDGIRIDHMMDDLDNKGKLTNLF